MTRPPAYPDGETRELDEALRQWIQGVPAGFVAHASSAPARYGLPAETFEQLDAQFEKWALALFEYQFERVPLYRAYARACDRTPSRVRCARDVPALPVEALRRERVAVFPRAHESLRFQTSGTTGRPGVLHLDSTELYDLALERGFAHHVVPDVERIRMVLLVPSREEAPHSSLSYMMQRVRERWGTGGSGTYVREGKLSWTALRREMEGVAHTGEAVCLLGTTFALVALLDTAIREAWRVRLPARSRVFETGGTKGRTRELSRSVFQAQVDEILGVPPDHIVSEYGMTELASQYYTLSLRSALLGEAVKTAPDAWSAPFWLRPRIMESESGRCADVESATALGLLAHQDLGNRCTVAHWLTADLASPHEGSFALHGRAPRAEARGCGLAYEGWFTPGEDG